MLIHSPLFRISALFLLACSIFFISSCGGDNNENSEVCSAEVAYSAPLLVIDSVNDSLTDESFVQVTISGITLDGDDLGVALLDRSVLENVDLVEETNILVCTIPCGLFTTQGEYSMTVSSPGYAPKTVSVNPVYELFSVGCPRTYSGSFSFSTSLNLED